MATGEGLFSALVAGQQQLFYKAGDGTTYQLTPLPGTYPYIRKNNVVRLPRFLVLGSNDTNPATDNFETWWRDCLLQDFPLTTDFIRNNANWDASNIADYDAIFFVVDGNNGYPAPNYLTTVANWVTVDGGGLVSGAWQLYNSVNWILEWADLDPAVPAIYGPLPQTYGSIDESYGLPILEPSHPVMRTLSSPIDVPLYPSAGGWGIEAILSPKPGCTTLANEQYTIFSGTAIGPSVIAGNMGTGKGVYLDYTSNTGVGDALPVNIPLAQLFRNAMWWAAGGQ